VSAKISRGARRHLVSCMDFVAHSSSLERNSGKRSTEEFILWLRNWMTKPLAFEPGPKIPPGVYHNHAEPCGVEGCEGIARLTPANLRTAFDNMKTTRGGDGKPLRIETRQDYCAPGSTCAACRRTIEEHAPGGPAAACMFILAPEWT
jgi:hypothetical protein